MSEIPEDMLKAACRAFSEARAVYPDGEAETPITDWFDFDAQDAVDFGVLTEPKWHGHSDIGNMQQEQYIAAVIKEPMRAALRTALSEAERREREARQIALEEAAQIVERRLGGLILDSFVFGGIKAKNGEGHEEFLSLPRVEKVVAAKAAAIRALIPSEPQPEKDKNQDDAEGRE